VHSGPQPFGRQPKPLIVDDWPVIFRGRLVYEIAGGDGTDDDGDGDEGTDDAELDDLLDGDGDEDGDGDGDGDEPPAWWTRAAKGIDDKIESAIDRRLNTRKQRPGSSRQGSQQQPTGPSSQDVRDARGVYRDEIREGGLTRDEREFALSIGGGVVTAALGSDGDPDRAGTTAAKAVVDQVKKIRRSAQQELLTRLKNRGALNEDKIGKQGPTNRPGAGGQKAPGEQYDAGAELARQMAAQRGNRVPSKTQ